MVYSVKFDLMIRLFHKEDLAKMWSCYRQITKFVEELDLVEKFSAWSWLCFAKTFAQIGDMS